jgi:hypothetical protein
MEEKLKDNLTYIKSISGISKRLYIAFNELISSEPDVENVLFNLCAVVDSNSKLRYPAQNGSRKRFIDYIDTNQEDFLFIYSKGIKISFDGFWNKEEKKRIKISEILYEIRCCNYHDPEQLKNYITIYNVENGFGLTKFDKNAAISLFLILFTDPNNKERIDKNLFKTIGEIGEHKLLDLIGERQKLLDIFRKKPNG